YSFNGSTGDNAGALHGITWTGGITGTTTFGYDAERATTTVTTSAGIYTSSYDADHRRVKIVDPSGNVTYFRYGFGRLPLAEKRIAGANNSTFDPIFIAGEPVS